MQVSGEEGARLSLPAQEAGIIVFWRGPLLT